ncbi:MAG TPA: tetratricopeptide repeat protein [Pyrinomonadaceae bacterium]|jgi:tetratricopeptide (TPR) repeat protein|nr:tetratricopeptide repeat protein [Pyrinomonadaceae bacterium]
MRKIILTPALAFALLAAPAFAAQLEAPKLVPGPETEQQTATIREGVALHERGDFDGAIRKYEEVLKENPASVRALYELAFAYSRKKDYKKSLEIAYRGAQYKWDEIGLFYQLIGNNLDATGEPKKAIEVYKAGLKHAPQMGLLHYNMAVTYKGMDKPEDARKSLKNSLALSPGHASSHLLLAVIFFQTGYRTPALFAATRFLTLEPKSERAAVALRIAQEVMGGGATQGKNPNEISIFMNLNTKKDEGDFDAIETVLGLSKALGMTEKNKGKTEAQLLVEQYDTVLAVVGEQTERKKQSAFVFKYYVPYFMELKQRGFVEPFVHYTHQRVLAGSGQWVEENSGRVMQFLSWSKNYKWPEEAK